MFQFMKIAFYLLAVNKYALLLLSRVYFLSFTVKVSNIYTNLVYFNKLP